MYNKQKLHYKKKLQLKMASSENVPTAGNSNANGLLTINRLNYTLPNDLSVSISRTGTSQFFQSKSYSPRQSMICILNTGAAYVNPERSYLRIDFKNTSVESVSFGQGSEAICSTDCWYQAGTDPSWNESTI